MFISYVKFMNPSFNEGAIHSQLYACFPANMGRILYKKEKILKNNKIEIYALVYSEKKPFSTPNVTISKSTEVNVEFQEGMMLNFEIQLSPEFTTNGKRMPQKVAIKRIEYVQRKLSNAGLHLIDDAREISSDVLRIKHSTGDYLLHTYVYRGTVVVENAEKLKDAYMHGVGHHKAYGCGMLCLKR